MDSRSCSSWILLIVCNDAPSGMYSQAPLSCSHNWPAITSTSIIGLVVEFVVAIDEARVRFTDDAFLFALRCLILFLFYSSVIDTELLLIISGAIKAKELICESQWLSGFFLGTSVDMSRTILKARSRGM